jgi:hypothetical protein
LQLEELGDSISYLFGRPKKFLLGLLPVILGVKRLFNLTWTFKIANMRSTLIVLSFLMATVPWESAFAKSPPLACSVHLKSSTPKASLAALATISQADAERTARASLNTSAPTTVTEGELEREHGCLVYSFDIRVSGKEGVEEVLIDAGTGKVLSHKHESSQHEAAESAAEKKSNHPR